MFDDALLEAGGRLRTRRGWFSGVALLTNSGLVLLLMVWPLLHPESLPKQNLRMLLAAPAPPASSAPHAEAAHAAARAATLVNPLMPPRIIPQRIAATDRTTGAPLDATGDPLARSEGEGLPQGLASSLGTALPPRVQAAPMKRPVISSGVMAGNRISGTEPQYPAIARAARVEGTVELHATISRGGMIANLQVVSGPPMLAGAAEAAVRTWRYRPYLLNGEPVAVETTVRVVFRLGG